MIVVVGTPAWRPTEPAAPAGLACGIALAAAAHGAAVELVGRTGDDPAGDALLIALAHAGVGHVARLRDPAEKAADPSLNLRRVASGNVAHLGLDGHDMGHALVSVCLELRNRPVA